MTFVTFISDNTPFQLLQSTNFIRAPQEK